jgi:hypothetical protein
MIVSQLMIYKYDLQKTHALALSISICNTKTSIFAEIGIELV